MTLSMQYIVPYGLKEKKAGIYFKSLARKQLATEFCRRQPKSRRNTKKDYFLVGPEGS